jgi:predicted regulator of Ras-like GTPase activity (Roadblock/LC7/MglB family)
MSNEAYAFALKNALTEIRNVCPDVQTSFLFDKEATLVAGDSETPETTLGRVVESLEGILNKSEALGGLNSIVIEGSKGSVHITRVDDLYLTMVASKDADMRYLETVARVLIPTVMKLLDSLSPTPLRHPPPSYPLSKPEVKDELKVDDEDEDNERDNQSEEADVEEREVKELERNGQLPLLDLPSNQLIVESFGGLLVRSDTVQISNEIMSQWEDLLEGKKIENVEIESFNGKASQCKVKALDDSKLENKAVIRIPEKLCQALDIKKGELVRVKPIVS